MSRCQVRLAGVLVCVLTMSAAAQSGPALMLKPWDAPEGEDDAQFELSAAGRFPSDGEVGEEDTDGELREGDTAFQMPTYESVGRFRTSTDRGATALGYDLVYHEIDTSDPALPQRLVDGSFSIGAGLGEWEQWEFAATAGAGYAGNEPIDNDDAWYGRGSLIAGKQLDSKRSVQLGLEYDGNRTIFPDAPLPLFAFNERVDEDFRYSLGVPYSSFTYDATDRITFEASTIAFINFSAEARYRVDEQITLFAGYNGDTTGFHLKGDDEHRRLFYEEQRLEGGFRYRPAEFKQARFVVAGGYAFSREFSRGFDVTDTDTVREVSDEPYFRAALELAF